MFTQQLSFFSAKNKSNQNKHSSLQTHDLMQDLHFQICSAFLKNVGDKFLLKQAEIMTKSSEILDYVNLNVSFPKKDFNLLSTNNSEWSPESQFQYEPEERVIMRRNKNRHNDNSVQQALEQVKELCNFLTFEVLSNLATQYGKLQTKIQGMDAKQYFMIKKQEAADKYHQQNIILKKKLEIEITKSQKLQDQIRSQKQKNQNISKKLQEKVNSIMKNQKILDINQKVYRQVKTFLQDKEMHVNSRLRKIEFIQGSIMQKIEGVFHQIGSKQIVSIMNDGFFDDTSQIRPGSNKIPCENCCLMLKKLKSSILDYRDYLENEAQEVNKLYEKHKSSLFTSVNRTINSNKSLG